MFFAPMRHKDAGLSHNPLKAIVSPRPIGWIASKGGDGSFNLAPYSFFNAISEDPAMVMFSVQSDNAAHVKDSLRNVEETGEFVVNITSQNQFDAMNISSGSYPYGENEFTLAGLEMVPSQTVAVPRAGGVPAALECTHFQTINLPRNEAGGGYILVIGTVTGIYIDDAIVEDGLVKYEKFIPISRLGYRDYGRGTDIFQATRPGQK